MEKKISKTALLSGRQDLCQDPGVKSQTNGNKLAKLLTQQEEGGSL